MQKLFGAGLLLVIIAALNTKAFAAPLNCTYKDPSVQVKGIQQLQIPENDDAIVINNTKTVPLEHSRIKCGSFGKQHRFDGKISADVQIILKSCSTDALLEGHLVDSLHSVAAPIVCDEAVEL